MTPELERYLRDATRGLWGKKRLEVREELTSHVLERTRSYELAGCTRHDAMARALEGLGDATTIRSAMIGVHMLPHVVRLGSLLTITAMLSFTMLPRTATAQIQSDTTGPAKLCRNCVADRSNRDLVWFDLRSLGNAFEQAGARVARIGTVYTVTIDNKSFQLKPSYTRGTQAFIVDWRLGNALSSTGLRWRIAGWQNAELTVGSARVRFSANDGIVPLVFMYRNVVSDYATLVVGAKSVGYYPAPSKYDQRHEITTGKPHGTVVALVTRDTNGVPMFDLQPVEADGTVTLRGTHEKLRFVTRADQLSPYPSGGRRNAVLLTLSGRMDTAAMLAGKAYEVFTPTQRDSDALR